MMPRAQKRRRRVEAAGRAPVRSARALATEYAVARWRAARLQAVPQAWCTPEAEPPRRRPPAGVPGWVLGVLWLWVLAASVLVARTALGEMLP